MYLSSANVPGVYVQKLLLSNKAAGTVSSQRLHESQGERQTLVTFSAQACCMLCEPLQVVARKIKVCCPLDNDSTLV